VAQDKKKKKKPMLATKPMFSSKTMNSHSLPS